MIFLSTLLKTVNNITTTNDFLTITNKVPGIFVLLSDLDFSNVSSFIPQVLNSTFNGNGHTLKNILINTPTTVNGIHYLGVFGKVCQNVTIENLNLNNVTISFESYGTSYNDTVFAGLLAA